MNLSKCIVSTILLMGFFYSSVTAQSMTSSSAKDIDYSTTEGPPKGSLVIVGGAMQDPAIFEKFMELTGGKNAHIVIVPTAAADSIPPAYFSNIEDRYKELGAVNITILHTKDRTLADSESFVKPILKADGIWFTGGRQWRIVDSYINTRTQRAFEEVLERGGVIGGSSAGATIQGSYLARGDTRSNTIMMGDHEKGFAYIKNVAIDQHLLQRNRQFDLIEIIEAKPHLLGIGLDENTAIVVQGNEFEVIGESFVAIYNHQRWEESDSDKEPLANGGKFILLDAGQRYNMKSREVISNE